MQPMNRFAFDARPSSSRTSPAVIPEALGQAYTFRDEGGIAMERRLDGRAMIEARWRPRTRCPRGSRTSPTPSPC